MYYKAIKQLNSKLSPKEPVPLSRIIEQATTNFLTNFLSPLCISIAPFLTKQQKSRYSRVARRNLISVTFPASKVPESMPYALISSKRKK